MPTTTGTPSALEKLLKDTLTGMQNSLPVSVTTLVVDGVSMAVPAILTKLTMFTSMFQAVHDARAVLNTSVKSRTDNEPGIQKFLNDLHASLTVQLGASSSLLAKMGKKPKKVRAKPTAATKAEAAKKTKLTKQARGEVGKKQRKQIKAPSPPKA